MSGAGGGARDHTPLPAPDRPTTAHRPGYAAAMAVPISQRKRGRSEGSDADAPVFEARGIWKAFPGVQALKDASFQGSPGHIHGLIGENGAGKSTLVRIVAGIHQADRGELLMNGSPLEIATPHEAIGLGISMVHQDTRLAPDLDAAHNIWLGREPTGRILIDRTELYRATHELLEIFDLPIDARLPIHELSAAQRQAVEIARALSLDAKLLILDEPTSALSVREVAKLFEVLRQVRERGVCVIFVSHRLPEVFEITDSVTVMKDGEVVGTVETEDTDEAELVRMMVGRPVDVVFPDKRHAGGAPTLSVAGLTSGEAFADVDLVVRPGEIVGLGGIEGNGQRELCRALFGLQPITDGTITIDGVQVDVRDPRRAIDAGVVYVSNDRHGEGLMLPLSVAHNIGLPTLESRARGSIIDRPAEGKAVATVIDEFGIKTSSPAAVVKELSGGNQQKVAVGRWTLAHPRVVVLDEPTQGVDVGSKLELYDRIRRLADSGVGVLLLSSDLIELIGLSDRIVVLSHGRVVSEVSGDDATEEAIVGAAVTATRASREAEEAIVESMRSRTAVARWLDRWRTPSVLAVAIALAALFATSQSPFFLTSANLGNLAFQVVPLALVVAGQVRVMLLGGIDLSIGSTMSLSAAVASFLIARDPPGGLALGILVCLAVGVAVGLANGAMIRFLRIPDLVVTLASLFMVNGLALMVRPSPGGSISAIFSAAVMYRVGPVPVAAAAALLLYFLYEVNLLRTRSGIRLYATGSSGDAAFTSGVNIDRVRMRAYVFSGTMAALGGLLLASRMGSGDPQAGTAFTLASVTAAVIGGVSLFGGRGTATGALMGAIIVVGIQNVLNLMHVSAYWQYVWVGLLTVIGVATYSTDWTGFAQRVRHMCPWPARSKG